MDDKEIEIRFTFHPPREGQPDKYIQIRNKAREFAELLNKLCPEGREKSLAITQIEQAVMWANAAVARRQP